MGQLCFRKDERYEKEEIKQTNTEQYDCGVSGGDEPCFDDAGCIINDKCG
ncbi:MAG: hypothetical protein IJY06_02155 [Oscillospiraceae bacterium]|nr:hypothetical protein [Oscillospiraceae bacterium]